ncbi:hypothetical protein [Methylovorus sp. MP688]|uniref:hypothetical protein n=1 Tax=Methylovorus sp. (strain MP688) TaxID=887061 RepID=UPI0001EC43C6|nr:hypothetical protein [Methylovorus sp. MP688]ADQ83566.1 hypothetical protein MPQ_0383 [Methylovorus sp. MP688]
MLTTVLSSVIGTICVAAILAALKSRWLYVIAPKLYLNTPISDGQIISINIFNAGLTAEEDVAVTFRQACKFELIGTSKSTLVINGKTISIPKLSRLESITIVLLIEGKIFDPIDIESVESKSTKGKVVESKEKATALWQTAIVIPIALLFLAVPFAFGTSVGAEMKVSAFDYLNDKLEMFGQSKQLSGFKTSLREISADNKFEGAIKDSKISVETTEVVRRGDVITIITKLSNNTKEPLMIEGYLKSSAGDKGPLSFWDERVETLALAPGEKKSVRQRAFLPEALSAKIIENRFSFESLSGESLSTSLVMEFN